MVGSALLGLVAIVHLRDPLQDGLTATFFSDTNWSSAPVARFIDTEPSTESFGRAFGSDLPDIFSATWVGTLVVLETDAYTFATESDDAASVFVDDVPVVDDSGRHTALRVTGTTRLERGAHRLLVKYAQYGGDASLVLLWGRRGRTLEPISPAYLFPRRADFSRLLTSVVVRKLVPIVLWVWVGLVCVALAGAVQPWMQRTASAIRSDRATRALAAIIFVSILLNVIGVWWGVPSDWAGDEIAPTTVRYALEQRFSSGWFDRYPPFHMQVLGAAFSPWLILEASKVIQASAITEYGVLLVLSRLVSVLAAAGIVLVLFKIGRESFGERAALFSAAAVTVLTPFLYYAKTANPEMPYVFWFTLSLLFYLRALRTLDLGDCLGFALIAILSICTKDQAYGLYLLTPIPLVYRLWESHRADGKPGALWRTASDRRVWIPFAAAVALFSAIHNIPFNPGGFVKHVRDITGAGQEGYQMADATIGGRLTLLRIVADLNQRSWGWPLSLIAIAGVVLAAVNGGTRRTTAVLLLIVVSYYIGFVNVIRYAFDRYLLPICVIEALFIGVALDWCFRTADQKLRVVARVVAFSIFAYTALYAGTVDVLMVRDARYAAERWLRARDAGHHLVGVMFPATVLPRLHDLHVAEIRTVDDLKRARPDFFLLNADYARAVPSDRPEAELAAALQHGALGYRLGLRSSEPSPWPWLPSPHPNLVGPRDEVPVLSVLTEVNPTIEIYIRDDHNDDR